MLHLNFFYFQPDAILVLFLSFIFVAFALTVFSLFMRKNILLTYMSCEFLLLLVLLFFLFYTSDLFLIKLQSFILLFLGLAAAEMALGLVIFIKFYRITKTID
jgi:NADH:ubiquinone oxidoreductase subunit K